jgi:hypothetical protein
VAEQIFDHSALVAIFDCDDPAWRIMDECFAMRMVA